MNIIKYNKLIRDKIPEIIQKSGRQPIIEALSTDDYKKYLNQKLSEELNEYLESGNIEELADMVEVVHAILKQKGIGISDFEDIRLKKAEERGAFNKRLLLREIIEE